MLKTVYSCVSEAGTDEAGRGCLAGPVTAAAVILPEHFSSRVLNDSKQLSAPRRKQLESQIKKEAVSFGIAHVYPEEIDKLNILKASIRAMHLALDQLATRPEAIAVDGNRFYPYQDIPHNCLVKGDAHFLNIAAASVLAKTARDAYMQTLHQTYPQYGWDQNKGYPTRAHRTAIKKFGITEHHRKSFQLLPRQLNFEF
jgi:ribonuclease HII